MIFFSILTKWGLLSITPQAAEKEAILARQEEEKAEHRKKSRAEKKAKKVKKAKPGDKRKAEEEDEEDEEWGEEAGEFYPCSSWISSHFFLNKRHLVTDTQLLLCDQLLQL